ncbi:hypothetical protein LTR17_017464 [Elasticomyces elasticus]|nr:hypothetical protein LTR17_017464 [Elasticomyces elasticus]
MQRPERYDTFNAELPFELRIAMKTLRRKQQYRGRHDSVIPWDVIILDCKRLPDSDALHNLYASDMRIKWVDSNEAIWSGKRYTHFVLIANPVQRLKDPYTTQELTEAARATKGLIHYVRGTSRYNHTSFREIEENIHGWMVVGDTKGGSVFATIPEVDEGAEYFAALGPTEFWSAGLAAWIEKEKNDTFQSMIDPVGDEGTEDESGGEDEEWHDAVEG